jgi:hypothetical protein
MTDDDESEEEESSEGDPFWFDSEPYGDQECHCPCGHGADLMPEETETPEETAWCEDCRQGRHEGIGQTT